MIEVQNLTKKFKERTVLNGISFQVKESEVVGVQLTIHVDRSCPSGEYPFAIVFQATGHEAQ